MSGSGSGGVMHVTQYCEHGVSSWEHCFMCSGRVPWFYGRITIPKAHEPADDGSIYDYFSKKLQRVTEEIRVLEAQKKSYEEILEKLGMLRNG